MGKVGGAKILILVWLLLAGVASLLFHPVVEMYTSELGNELPTGFSIAPCPQIFGDRSVDGPMGRVGWLREMAELHLGLRILGAILLLGSIAVFVLSARKRGTASN